MATLGRPVGTASAPDRKRGIKPFTRLEVPGDLEPGTFEHFDAWARLHLVQYVDQWAGMPLVFEDWQCDFLREVLACDEDGLPKWDSVVLVVPRKNGKSTMLAALALYSLIEGVGQPEILLAAASDKQAGRMFETVVNFIYRSENFKSRTHLREYVGEVARSDGGGKILRMASDPSTLHGYNPSRVICDELHAWTKPGHRKAWAALTTAGGARRLTQVVTITTAGNAEDREDSILGHLIDVNERDGECEHREALTISRNHAARTLVYNYSAPTSDPRKTQAMKLANPASWITEEYLARQAANPELSSSEVLQLHGCVWAAGVNAWVTAEQWRACLEDVSIPPLAEVFVGIDVALKQDSSAVVTAWQSPDGRQVLEAKVWSPRDDVVAHEYVHGGTMDMELVEDYCRELARTYSVREFVYDERFFTRSASMLAEDGLPMVEIPQASGAMAEAWNRFRSALLDKRLAHSGDPVLQAHVLSAQAQNTDRGWKVSKVKQHRKIDALVAAAMANYRLEVVGQALPWVSTW